MALFTDGIDLTPELAALQIPGVFQFVRGVQPDQLRTRMEYDEAGRPTTTPKLYNGKPVIRIPAQYIDDAGVDPNVSINVLTRPTQSIKPLTQFTLSGEVHATAWVKNGRVAWSLIADKLQTIDPMTGAVHD